jgi:hypothetical protein
LLDWGLLGAGASAALARLHAVYPDLQVHCAERAPRGASARARRQCGRLREQSRLARADAQDAASGVGTWRYRTCHRRRRHDGGDP